MPALGRIRWLMERTKSGRQVALWRAPGRVLFLVSQWAPWSGRSNEHPNELSRRTELASRPLVAGWKPLRVIYPASDIEELWAGGGGVVAVAVAAAAASDDDDDVAHSYKAAGSNRWRNLLVVGSRRYCLSGARSIRQMSEPLASPDRFKMRSSSRRLEQRSQWRPPRRLGR